MDSHDELRQGMRIAAKSIHSGPAPALERLSRRRFLQAGAWGAGIVISGMCPVAAFTRLDPSAAGTFVRLIEFEREGEAPVDRMLGAELDGRLYTDLSRISAGRTITPTEEFYIRTGASRILPGPARWQIAIDGLVEKSTTVGNSVLRSAARPMGPHLMECAGNVRLTRFGLISVATWSGVPVMELLDRAKPQRGGSQVLVSGFDTYETESRTSIPGASWIFPVSALRSTQAFLATQMNGRPLTADHGAPVRLVVPGWYGCACIKWVNRITLVDDSAEATLQMQEYASRTLQAGIPQIARDFEPATVDFAAMPVRVEQWKLAGKLRYRIVGIAWGGSEPVARLRIRFNPGEEFTDVTGFQQPKNDPWTIWTHDWVPSRAGEYNIQLAVAEPQVRARKLDAGYYVRTVIIGETQVSGA